MMRRTLLSWKAMTALAVAGGGLASYLRVGAAWREEIWRTAAGLWLGLVVLRVVWTAVVYPFYVSPLRAVPTAGGSHWLFGHGWDLVKSKTGGPFREWMTTTPNDGMLRYFWFLNRERILLTSAKSLAEVLVTNSYAFRKPESISTTLSPMLGYGILLTEGDAHRRQRRNLNPAFAFRHVKDLYPVFWDKACEAVREMTAACGAEGGAALEVGGWASRATLDIIGVAGLGRDFHALSDQYNELVRTYELVFTQTTATRVLAVLATFLPGWFVKGLPVQRNRDVAREAGKVRAVCRELIGDKKRRMANKEQRGVDILSVALECGQFSDDELVDQLMTFLAAGHETTSAALTWAVYMLCVHPGVQARLRREVRERLPSTMLPSDPANSVTSADIDRMPYLSAVCSEVLRVWSPIPTTMRQAEHDTTIQGVAIPRGTVVLLSPWAINVSPEAWGGGGGAAAAAGVFDPERWLAGEDAGAEERGRATSGGASSNYAFLTFLHGPRSCIGASFARAEMACLLAAWVGRFEFSLVDERLMDVANMEVKMEVTARPANGLHVRVKVLDEY